MKAALERHGLGAQRVGPFPPGRGSGTAAADAVLNSGATACVAFNDLLAIGMLTRLRERGVRVPADLSVVGCDDIFGADFCNPPLTTLTAPIEQAGRVAVSLLLVRPRPPGAAAPAPGRGAADLPDRTRVDRTADALTLFEPRSCRRNRVVQWTAATRPSARTASEVGTPWQPRSSPVHVPSRVASQAARTRGSRRTRRSRAPHRCC